MSVNTTASPNYFRFHCVCNWGVECFNLKKLLDEAGDDHLTRMIPIKSGASELSISLRSAVKLHFKLGSEDDGLDFYVAAHHWTPSLISKSYEGSKGNRPSRQFKILLTPSEARSYDWSMSENINNFESCMRRAGVSIPREAGEFQIRKRGAGSMVTPTIASAKTAKKPTPKSKQAEDETEVEEEGCKG
jgi:hypothetical protein